MASRGQGIRSLGPEKVRDRDLPWPVNPMREFDVRLSLKNHRRGETGGSANVTEEDLTLELTPGFIM